MFFIPIPRLLINPTHSTHSLEQYAEVIGEPLVTAKHPVYLLHLLTHLPHTHFLSADGRESRIKQ